MEPFKFKALIYLLTKLEGGRSNMHDKYQGVINIDEMLGSAVIKFPNEIATINVGNEYLVTIFLPFPERIKNKFFVGASFTFFEGDNIIPVKGKVLEIL